MSCRALLLSGAGLLAVTMALSPLLAAPGLKTDAKPEAANSPEAIRKALDTPNNFEFKEQNLGAILNTISEQYKIQIALDRSTVQMMGMAVEEMNVDLNMKNTKLKTALRALVGQYNLTYVISDGHLVITTEEAAVHRQLKQRIEVNYDNVPLQTAVKELSSKHGVSVVFDPKTVKTKTAQNLVTLQVDDVPFEAAIRLMCEMADLKPARMGNVIYITSEARADKLKDSDTLVPAPKMINPNMPFVPGGFGGFAGNIGGVAMPAQLIPAPAPGVDPLPPAKEAPPEKDAPPAKDAPKPLR